MIEFSGEISEDCKRYIQKIATKGSVISSLIVSVIACIILVIVGILWEWIIMICMIVPLLMVIFAAIPKINSPIKTLNLYLPKRMVIEDGMINLENEYRSEFRFIEDVDRIVDMGDWYHILFCFPKKSLYYVCQKNLLVEGTLEEFEKLFEGEIQSQFERANKR